MEDVSNLCRACLSSMDSFKYVLFENVSPDIYWFCTSIEVMKEEQLSKFLCDTCYGLLIKFSEFKSTCIKSQNTLSKQLHSKFHKTENVHITQQSLGIYKNNKLETSIEHRPSYSAYKDIFNDTKNIKNIVKEEDADHSGNDLDAVSLVEDLLIEKKEQSFKRVKIKSRKRKQKVYICNSCNQKFYCVKLFKAHKSGHQTKILSLKCLPCNKSFITKSGFKRHHIICHTSVSLSSIQCHICGKIAKSRETLRQHMKLHENRCQFICNVCGKGYSTRGVLKDHLETHKENREREYTCEHCGKKFFTNKNLLSHVNRCHSEKRFICQICSYPFTDKYNLAQHLLIHEGKKLFKCEVCNKSYATRSTYVEHQRIHSGERPYDCSYCAKSFISKRRLNVHLLIHTGEKPHKCPVCEQSFNQRGSLNRHMKVHDRIVDTI